MEATGSHGFVVKLGMRRASAGIAVLEGRPDDALVALSSVLADYRALGLPFPVATTGLLMASLLDGAIPEVGAATDEARTIFEGLGARAWLDRLDEASAARGEAEQASAEPAERVASSG